MQSLHASLRGFHTSLLNDTSLSIVWCVFVHITQGYIKLQPNDWVSVSLGTASDAGLTLYIETFPPLNGYRTVEHGKSWKDSLSESLCDAGECPFWCTCVWYIVSERALWFQLVLKHCTVSPIYSGLISEGWCSPGQAENGLCFLAPHTSNIFCFCVLEARTSKPPCRALSASPS